MLTQITFQISGGGSATVDTQQTALPIAVQSELPELSHGAPYLRDGRVYVDFTNRAPSLRELTVLFAKRWGSR